jgi:nicotinate-nucleotide adenylyltransferase
LEASFTGRIGVFGGSFNPPTQAHLMLSEHLLDRFVDQVLFLPVGDAFSKPELIAAAHRLAMLRLVCERNPRFAVSDIEIQKVNLSYTFGSLTVLQKEYPDASIHFILGSDHLHDLVNWYRADDLFSTFHFVLLARSEDDAESRFMNDPWLAGFRNRFKISSEHPRTDLSSSMVRRRISSGESIRYLVEECVIDYINNHGLYQRKEEIHGLE